MFILYIALGIVSGVIAAIVVLISGGGLLKVVVAYALAGLAGMLAGLIWANLPTSGRTAKQATPQRH